MAGFGPWDGFANVCFRPGAVIALVRLLHFDLDDVVEFPRTVEGRRFRTIDRVFRLCAVLHEADNYLLEISTELIISIVFLRYRRTRIGSNVEGLRDRV